MKNHNSKQKLIFLAGLPGSGKTSIGRIIAEKLPGKSAHIPGDWLYNMVVNSWVHPCHKDAQILFPLLWKNIAKVADTFLEDKMNVIIDYVFHWRQVVEIIDRINMNGLDIKCALIDCTLETALARDKKRASELKVGEDKIRKIFEENWFSEFDKRLYIKNDHQNPQESAENILNENRFCLNPIN